MREIKFRAWHTGEKIFWYFNLVTVRTSKAIDRDWFRLEPAQQYTGLQDRDGKEIYEGDVVNVPYNHLGNRVAEWVGSEGRWSVARYNLSQCLVIGNIYENPELLKP